MDLFWQQFDKISAFLWDPFLLLALGGAGVFCTLRFGDVCNLLGFRGEEGKLFSLDGRFVCQA